MKKVWSISVLMSGVLLMVLIYQWSSLNQFSPQLGQLVSEKQVESCLASSYFDHSHPDESARTARIKTGYFIQSLNFLNSSEVYITGYIWQHHKSKAFCDAFSKISILAEDNNWQKSQAFCLIRPNHDAELPFIFPEQVQTHDDDYIKRYYSHTYASGDGLYSNHSDMVEIVDDMELIGWYFEATLKQPFNYFLYPFDHKEVWVRLWSSQFSKGVIFVPDFDGYRSTDDSAIFGIEEDIVLSGWERDNTYFNFHRHQYTTNFGFNPKIHDDATPSLHKLSMPELYYNFVVRREFANALIVHFLPIFIVASLLFAAFMTLSRNSALKERHGFNTFSLLGFSSALLFVILLAHTQLRQQFSGAPLVYMEFFYFLMYVILLCTTCITYKFSKWEVLPKKGLFSRDGLYLKAMYWPVILLSMIVITEFFVHFDRLERAKDPSQMNCVEPK